LIDPALLRPGRIDKALLCPMPDKVSHSIEAFLAERSKLVIVSILILNFKINYETLSFFNIKCLPC
jgi:ATP-dependent 26S proteasome regulatory subunit